MIYCYFDNTPNDLYNCEYSFKNNNLEIVVDFGANVHMFSEYLMSLNDTKSYAKTITIIDRPNNFYIKTFYAFEMNCNANFGEHSRIYKTYLAKSFFKTKHEDYLLQIDNKTLISNIVINHKCLDYFINNKAKIIEQNDNITTIKLDSSIEPKATECINKNNISTIDIISSYSGNLTQNGFDVNYTNKMKINFTKKISINDLTLYYKIITIMFNIYYCQNTPINKIGFYINNCFYEYINNFSLNDNSNTINLNKKLIYPLDKYIIAFLKKFDIKKENFNLLSPFAKDTFLYAEDSFIIFYRFAELVKKNNNTNWLKELYAQNKELLLLLNLKYDPSIPVFMESLRNHYVHEGFYIPSNMINIKHGKGKRKRVNNEIIVSFSRTIKAFSYKIMLNDLLNLRIADDEIIKLI